MTGLGPLEDQPRGHDEPVGGTDGTNPKGKDGGKEAEGDDPGGDGKEVPEELEHASGPVQVVLLWVGVPEVSRISPIRM